MTAITADNRAQRIAVIQTVALVTCCLVIYLPTVLLSLDAAVSNPEAAHLFAVLVMVGVLIVLRRHALSEDLSSGSAWGIAVILLGLLIFSLSKFPFNYGYPVRLSLAPTLAGATLAIGGWRFMFRCLPMILLLILSIPPGTRYWAFLIIKPETVTLEAVRVALDMLPGVTVTLEGLDLSYVRGDVEGTIALGQSNRGASLFLSYLTIGVFVTFARIRPIWQILVMAVMAVPIVLFCNLIRLIFQGIASILTGASPLDPMPRIVETILSLVIAYLLFVGTAAVLNKIVIEGSPEPAAA